MHELRFDDRKGCCVEVVKIAIQCLLEANCLLVNFGILCINAGCSKEALQCEQMLLCTNN